MKQNISLFISDFPIIFDLASTDEMAKATFSSQFLNNVKAPDGVAQVDFFDGKAPHLALRVSQATKMWYRTLSLLCAVFNFAVGHALIDINPTARLKPRHKAISRDRLLSTAGLPVVWCAVGDHGHVSSTIIRLMLLMAQCGGEIRQMRWNDIDLNSSWWTVPGEIAKNSRAHRVPLCHRARVLDNFLHLLGLQHTKIVRGYLFYYLYILVGRSVPPCAAFHGGATLFTPHNATRSKPASTRDLTPGIRPRIGLLQWRGDQGGASVLSRLRRCHRAFTTWRCGVTRTALRESRH